MTAEANCIGLRSSIDARHAFFAPLPAWLAASDAGIELQHDVFVLTLVNLDASGRPAGERIAGEIFRPQGVAPGCERDPIAPVLP